MLAKFAGRLHLNLNIHVLMIKFWIKSSLENSLQLMLPILDVSSFLLDNSTLFWMLAPYSGRGYLILDVSTLFWIIWHLICKALECLKKFLCIGLLVPVGLQRAVILHFIDLTKLFCMNVFLSECNILDY